MNRPWLQTAFALIVVFVASASTAQAAFDLMQIEQAIGGVNGDTTAQAIQLRMRSASQNFVSGTTLLAYDSAGLNPLVLLTFPTSVSNGSLGDRILITTPDFANYTDIPLVADFSTMTPIPPSYLAAGKISYVGDAIVGDAIVDDYWSLAFGGNGYTGSTCCIVPFNDADSDGEFGPPFAGPLPSAAQQALLFQGAPADLSNTNLTDYALTSAPAVFTNNAGASFTVIPEPSTFLLAALGLLALLGFARRRRK